MKQSVTFNSHVHPAVHRDCSPGHVCRTVGCKKSDHLRDLLSLPQTTQRNLGLQRFTLRFRQIAGHVGIDETRSHRVHGNRPRANLTRQSTTETFQTSLGGGVVYLASVAHGTYHRTNTDDSTPASLGHAAQNALGQAIQTVQVGIDHVVPLVVFHAHHQVVTGNTGVVHQDRRRAELLLDAGQYGSNGLVAGDVELKAGALNAVFLQGGSNTLGTRSGSCGTHNDRAQATQFKRDGLANTAAGAGNQCNFTLQTHAGFS
ncbi:hypothetical protein EMIT051CA3_11129 [Pseudomonas chlororaphis]